MSKDHLGYSPQPYSPSKMQLSIMRVQFVHERVSSDNQPETVE